MCIICLELDKLNLGESISNLYETRSDISFDHYENVLIRLSRDVLTHEVTNEEAKMFRVMLGEMINHYED